MNSPDVFVIKGFTVYMTILRILFYNKESIKKINKKIEDKRDSRKKFKIMQCLKEIL